MFWCEDTNVIIITQIPLSVTVLHNGIHFYFHVPYVSSPLLHIRRKTFIIRNPMSSASEQSIASSSLPYSRKEWSLEKTYEHFSGNSSVSLVNGDNSYNLSRYKIDHCQKCIAVYILWVAYILNTFSPNPNDIPKRLIDMRICALLFNSITHLVTWLNP